MEVTIDNLNGVGFHGVTYVSDNCGFGALVSGWQRLPTGKFGPIQKHGGIKIGDALYAMNDSVVINLEHKEIINIFENPNYVVNKLVFISSDEHYRRRKGVIRYQSGAEDLYSTQNKPSFRSFVTQYRLNQNELTKSSEFVEYRIDCNWDIIASNKLNSTQTFKWNIWKRYSQFRILHDKIATEFGWQTEGLIFPSPHTFVWDKFSREFCERRREELNAYWTRLMSIGRINDFMHRQHCSAHLYDFLDISTALTSSKTTLSTPSEAPKKESYPSQQSSSTTLSLQNGALISPPEQSGFSGAPGLKAPSQASLHPSVARSTRVETGSKKYLAGQNEQVIGAKYVPPVANNRPKDLVDLKTSMLRQIESLKK